MAYTIPLEFYEILEEKVGKETASKLVKVLEESVENSIKEGFEKQKVSISEELKKELASKYDVELIRKEIEIMKIELETRIEKTEDKIQSKIDKVHSEIEIVKKDVEIVRKEMRFMFILLLVVVVALNQNSLEFIAKIFGLIK